MNITTKGRYALRIMIDLALQPEGEYVSLKAISERQEVSIKYLEAIVAMLNKAGLVESFRGKNGGYRLTKTAEQYDIGSILTAAEGSLAPVSCLAADSNPCPRSAHCLTLPLWQGLDQVVDNYLRRVTLADILNGRIPK